VSSRSTIYLALGPFLSKKRGFASNLVSINLVFMNNLMKDHHTGFAILPLFLIYISDTAISGFLPAPLSFPASTVEILKSETCQCENMIYLIHKTGFCFIRLVRQTIPV
jgi:hypothetical protein